jgi:predicted NAD/FAD-binding protein
VDIAVVGTGIAGLTCVELLRRDHHVVVFEADDRPGGHTHTVDVDLPEGRLAVDTGFLVYTERAYPLLTRLFARLGTPTQPADMSFSVSDELTGVQWRGTSPATVLAQPANALRPEFWRMLVDVTRFQRFGQRLLADGSDDLTPLRELVADRRWSAAMVEGFLLPFASAIWSADPADVLEMPARTLFRFMDRHGMLRLGDQPPWRTVTGGARRYVDAILEPLAASGDLHLGHRVTRLARTGSGVEVTAEAAGRRVEAHVDQVVVAVHSDQALGMLEDPDPLEAKVLGATRYQTNRALLHTDHRLLPSARRARASWNYHRLAAAVPRATVTYDIRRLQSLPTATDVLVTLNRPDAVDPATVLRHLTFDHPIIDAASVAARSLQDQLNGRRRTWFCGAYFGDGFHEDGVRSAVAVCRRLAGAEL